MASRGTRSIPAPGWARSSVGALWGHVPSAARPAHPHCLTQHSSTPSTALLCHCPVQPMESTHCSQDLGAACLALGQKDGKRGKLVLLLCTAQGLWQCPGEGRHPDPPEPHTCSARLGLHPAALDAWEGREAAEHIQTWLPGGDKLVPLGHMCLGQGGRVQALGAPQHPKEGQKAHKSHSQAVTPSELHDTAGWGGQGR